MSAIILAWIQSQAFNLAFAHAILQASPGTVEPTPSERDWPAVSLAVQHAAIGIEIMDPRERRYLLASRGDFADDLDSLRRRYQDLRDAPRISDALPLPDRRQVNEWCSFNRRYRQAICDRMELELDRLAGLNEVASECDELYAVWDAIRDANCDFYYIAARRQALKKLRVLVGEEAYQRGEFPPYVPVWRFEVIQ